jgi:hypothetical protein
MAGEGKKGFCERKRIKSMINVKFYMKSGNIITFDCEEITITRNGLGIITGYNVKHGNSQNRILDADLGNIEGVVTKDIEDSKA